MIPIKPEPEFRGARNPSSVRTPDIYKEEELEEGAAVVEISGGGVFYLKSPHARKDQLGKQTERHKTGA